MSIHRIITRASLASASSVVAGAVACLSGSLFLASAACTLPAPARDDARTQPESESGAQDGAATSPSPDPRAPGACEIFTPTLAASLLTGNLYADGESKTLPGATRQTQCTFFRRDAFGSVDLALTEDSGLNVVGPDGRPLDVGCAGRLIAGVGEWACVVPDIHAFFARSRGWSLRSAVVASPDETPPSDEALERALRESVARLEAFVSDPAKFRAAGVPASIPAGPSGEAPSNRTTVCDLLTPASAARLGIAAGAKLDETSSNNKPTCEYVDVENGKFVSVALGVHQVSSRERDNTCRLTGAIVIAGVGDTACWHALSSANLLQATRGHWELSVISPRAQTDLVAAARDMLDTLP